MNPPFLIVDAASYAGENPPWGVLVAHPNVCGVIIKATQGTSYRPSWFARNWSQVREVAGSRYGDTWFRGCYHYLTFDVDGAKQADYYLAAVEAAGGWGRGDIMPIVDVELGGPNGDATAREIIDTTTAFARRVKQVLGRGVILYGRGAMRDLGIQSRMGCDAVWNPSYTDTMVMNGLGPSWSRDDVVLWQYAGDGVGDARVHGLPLTLAGFPSNMDMSVYVDGARKPSLASLRRRLLGSPLDVMLLLGLGAFIALALALSRVAPSLS